MNQVEENPDISAFLASAIHDMKNSISMLIVFLEEVLGQVNEQNFPAYMQMAQMLYEVKRVNGNLIQLLTVYKVGNKFYPFDLAQHSLEEFITEILLQSRALLEFKGIEVAVDVEEGLHWYFDRELVAGVVSHALNNVAHYTEDKVRLTARKTDGNLEIRIEDNGSGYPPAMLEAGEAVSRGVNFATGSTGLGLYFSSMVAKLHKNQGRTGYIRLENGGEYGGGCFVLSLP